MAIYLVENEDAPINNWGCYWLVKASNAKEAVDLVYREEDRLMPAWESGILKRKLTAKRVDNKLFGDSNSYMIA